MSLHHTGCWLVQQALTALTHLTMSPFEKCTYWFWILECCLNSTWRRHTARQRAPAANIVVFVVLALPSLLLPTMHDSCLFILLGFLFQPFLFCLVVCKAFLGALKSVASRVPSLSVYTGILLPACKHAERTASLWSSRSWLDKMGTGYQKKHVILSLCKAEGLGDPCYWPTILYQCCWLSANIQLYNTYLNKYI